MPTLQKILETDNVAELLSKSERETLAKDLRDGLQSDLSSRSEWEERNREAMNLALQVAKKKSTPWENASNVKFPLITIGAIQFSSRTYPAMVNGTEIVKCRTVGEDPEGLKAARARRVSSHMSYQLLEQDEGWEEEFDKLLMSLPIMGCGFKKTYFDPQLGHNVSVNVFPKHLVVDYYARSLETAKRVTHCLEFYKNEVIEKQRSGLWLDFDLDESTNRGDDAVNERQGTYPADSEATHKFPEMHTYIDLDDDGYEEPYVVTFHKDSDNIARIVKRFDENDIEFNSRGQIQRINPEHYFIKYPFIPAPDGGFYDLGFGALLGPITESINTIINQLIDAGTLSNMPTGFIGRGARLQGGEYKFKGGEFKQINATGDDLRKNIFMLPIKEPSQTLFQLLGLLIEYGERISGVTDMMAGQTPGQNTPATTAMAALEQGQKVFSGIHKRTYRALRQEYRRHYKLNRKFLNPEEYFQVLDGEESKIFQMDYMGDPTEIHPTADPSVSSTQQRVAKAQLIKENAMTGLHPYNGYEVEKRILEAAEISQVDTLLDPEAEIPPDPAVEIESAKFQADQKYKSQQMELEYMKADADFAVKETQAILNLAKAKQLGDETEMKEFELQVKTIQEKRAHIESMMKHEVEMKKLDKQASNDSR